MTFPHIFPLEIFPQSSIASSIVTVIWVGIFVCVFFNLRFGWALSGLMVPGYLVPMAMSKPWNATAVLIEAVIVYLLAKLIAFFLPKIKGTSEFFGRDRFFLILIISVFIRIIFDFYLFPIIASYSGIDYHGDLESYGLVIIALIANQFYKPKLLRGLFTLFITCTITFLLVNYLLVPLTNFSLSNLAYMYEYTISSPDIAAKSYIVLLTTAFIASRLNLRYSWDFGGILMPALLALHWYEPLRILITFAEAFVILFIGKAILYKSTIYIDGARKTLLFFNISFALNILCGFVIEHFWPQINAVDYFGIGYLLSTLIAIKIHDKDTAIKTTYATIHTVFVSVIAASAIGFALMVFMPETPLKNNLAKAIPNIQYSDQSLEEFLQDFKLNSYNVIKTEIPLMAKENFTRGLEALFIYLQDKKSPQKLVEATQNFANANYNITNLQNKYWILQDNNNQGLYIFTEATTNDLLVVSENCSPISGLAALGHKIFNDNNAKALVISSQNAEFLPEFSSTVASKNILFLNLADKNQLQIKGKIADGLSATYFKKLVEDIAFEWNAPYQNTLSLNAPTIDKIIATRKIENSRGSLPDLLAKYKDAIAPEKSNLYKAANADRLHYIEAEILTPLYNYVAAHNEDEGRLWHIADNAALVGYKIINFTDERGEKYILLAEEITSNMKHWGTYIFKLGTSAPYIIAAPHPLADEGSFEYATSLFKRLDAGVLCLAGANPKANGNTESDADLAHNKFTLFNLVHQTWLKQSNSSPMQVIHIRNYYSHNDSGIILALKENTKGSPELTSLQDHLLSLYKDEGTEVKMADGSSLLEAGYEVPLSPELAYAEVTPNKNFAVVWLPPALIKNVGQDAVYFTRGPQFWALNIPTEKTSISNVLATHNFAPMHDNKLLSMAANYIETGDIITLENILKKFPQIEIKHIFDSFSEQSYLTFAERGQFLIVASLTPLDKQSHAQAGKANKKDAIEKYLSEKKAFLTGAIE
jgi:hypothetical protein